MNATFALVCRFVCMMDRFIEKVFYAVVWKIADDLHLQHKPAAPGPPPSQGFNTNNVL